ncbi:GGDEF domain-containing protein [Rhodoferax sp.]|uniref:GGDEF domain-containing protein n=1 Tax=Rhodoferax sp. TaxID=50421 RepID=UPI002620337A|nr:GGDEF domain-containing protein [Rhodoferax sp.]MDD2925700.1 GGDEF domain-containing protein [Rhodoferax sp.]
MAKLTSVKSLEPPAPTSDPARVIAEEVRTDQLHLLFRQSFFATFGSFVAACILGWLHWNLGGSHNVIHTWLALLGASSLLRLVMFLTYFRTPERLRIPSRWERVYWLTLLLSAGIWGIGALVLMADGELLLQAITMMFTVGMAGSAVSTYSAYRSMTLSAVGLVLLPCTTWLLVQPSLLQRGLALAVLLFSASVVRATRELSVALQNSFRLTHEMALAHRIASHAAQTDVLTGINNRRAFFERAEQLLNYCQRNQRPLCVLAMDLDHFKDINDTHGHQAGDMVLRQVGELLQTSFRSADICGRLGGEEFALLLADTQIESAQEIAEQLRSDLSNLIFELPQGHIQHISASLGVAAADLANDSLQTLLQRADEAMYRAKTSGRNRVVTAAVA